MTRKPKAKKTNYKRRAGAMTRRRAPSAPRDGTNLLVNTYFRAKIPITDDEQTMSYSIFVDPKNGKVELPAGSTIALDDGANNALAAGVTNYLKYSKFADLYNQYKVNSAVVRVRVDKKCGTDNAVICANDKGINTPLANMAQAVAGAHKSFSMSDSRRELKYGTKFIGQEKDYRGTDNASAIVDNEKKYIKVFQTVPNVTELGYAAGTQGHHCEHQVQVILSLSMKDSSSSLN